MTATPAPAPGPAPAGTDGALQRWTKAGPLAGILAAPQVIGHIGGYFLILSAVLAFYAASALVMNATYGRVVLPLFGKA